jgi:hypothetical protein
MDRQLAMAERHGVAPVEVSPDSKVGVAMNLRDRDLWPVNGLRHPPTGDTCGWYLWAGEELPEDPDFFTPLHAIHVADWRSVVIPYLLLPPGWRFLITPEHEDVWRDDSLLDV